MRSRDLLKHPPRSLLPLQGAPWPPLFNFLFSFWFCFSSFFVITIGRLTWLFFFFNTKAISNHCGVKSRFFRHILDEKVNRVSYLFSLNFPKKKSKILAKTIPKEHLSIKNIDTTSKEELVRKFPTPEHEFKATCF